MRLDVVDKCVDEVFYAKTEAAEYVLLVEECLREVPEPSPSQKDLPKKHIPLILNIQPTQPSIISTPTLELKPLPPCLRYTFLGDKQTLPVIIFSKLTFEKETSLVEMLRRRVNAIGWQISDIRGISQSYCMHKILMEEGCKPTIERQRRLNLNMQEVVKKKIVRLLNACIIHPISDFS